MWIVNILFLNLSIVLITELILGFLTGAKNARKIVTVLLVNVITNPLVVLSMLSVTMFLNTFENICIVIFEVIVVFLEGFIYSSFGTFENKNPYLVSLILNMFSFLSGEIINIIL